MKRVFSIAAILISMCFSVAFAQGQPIKVEDFNLALVHPENYLSKEISFNAVFCLQNYDTNQRILNIRAANSIDDCYNRYIDVILTQDSPDFDKYAVTSPLHYKDKMQVVGFFKEYDRKYQSRNNQYIQVSSISATPAEKSLSSMIGSQGFLIGGIVVIALLALVRVAAARRKQ
ncbi:hypothetical protein [Bdellovibrio sp. NC01]|uniref:hypothetical protein n=1 Tax=Bdellovibrio sp. NC01 TaxID=2220073 RepID=UPI00115BA983|nr:hypothetical protein [Bdellovibrio sp. NC01]QDK36408.1 hypothetical protein DOE51_01725 [Bdellovibrio sp. NC01]